MSSAISIPFPKFDFYAACVAATHAIFAAAVYRAWLLTERRVTAVRVAVAIVVGLAAAFSAVGIVALGLPHPELAIPALAAWFFIALARHTYIAASFWLVACLAIREDAGFHVFGLLALWIAVLTARQAPADHDLKWLLRFAVTAFAYSTLAFIAKLPFTSQKATF